MAELALRVRRVRVRVCDLAFRGVECLSELGCSPTDCPARADEGAPGGGEVRRDGWLVAGVRRRVRGGRGCLRGSSFGGAQP